jgi:hypothetical protein
VRKQSGRSPPTKFLEFFGQFPGDTKSDLRRDLLQNGEGFGQPMRRFKIEASFFAGDGPFEFGATPSTFHGEESAKEK